MPYALAADKLTSILTTEAIRTLLEEHPEVLEQLRERYSLTAVAQEWAGLTDPEVQYLEAIPQALREGIRAAVAEAASDGKAVHVQYSPGYDFSVQMWDYGAGMSVHVTGPYPPDYPRNSFVEPRG
jgi:hypothetical protein